MYLSILFFFELCWLGILGSLLQHLWYGGRIYSSAKVFPYLHLYRDSEIFWQKFAKTSTRMPQVIVMHFDFVMYIK